MPPSDLLQSYLHDDLASPTCCWNPIIYSAVYCRAQVLFKHKVHQCMQDHASCFLSHMVSSMFELYDWAAHRDHKIC